MGLAGAATGALLALGLLLIASGLRGGQPTTAGRPPAWLSRTAFAPAVAGVAAAVLMLLLTGWLVGALLVGIAATAGPRAVRRAREQERHVQRTEAVATWTEMLRDTLAAAAGLEQAIQATATLAPAPIRPEITRLAHRLEHGHLPEALDQLADELANPAADRVIVALRTTARHQGRDLSGLLDALVRATRAEADLHRQVHASRARTRTATRVIIATLGLFAAGLVLFNRDYLAPYATVEGQAVLLLVGALVGLGLWLLQRMSRIEQPARVLTRREPGRAS